MKNKQKNGSSIAYQNKDIMSKLFAERICNKSLKVYGLNLPRIVQALPTNLPFVEANELRLDNLFLLEDGSLALIDYESAYKEELKLKYLSYISRILKRYFLEKQQFVNIRLIVIYTTDIKYGETSNLLDAGSLQLNINEAFLCNMDSEKVLARLQKQIESGNDIAEEEMMELIVLPLTYKGTYAQNEAIKQVITLSEKLHDEETRIFVLSGLLVFTDKVIDINTSKLIQRRIAMTKVGQLFEEEKIQAVEENTKETSKEITRRLLKSTEFSDERIAELVPSLSINEIHALREETRYSAKK